jgi:hypothetical protein
MIMISILLINDYYHTRWVAFAAYVCVQGWRAQYQKIREWALEARTICMERLQLTGASNEPYITKT